VAEAELIESKTLALMYEFHRLNTLEGNPSGYPPKHLSHLEGTASILDDWGISSMAKTKLTSGMWRIDPQKWSRVIDRCGQPVASVEADADSNTNASLIAAAPDMFKLLETLEKDASIPETVQEEIQLVLRRARGDFGLAVFSRNVARHLRSRTQEWLKFMEGLWNLHEDSSE